VAALAALEALALCRAGVRRELALGEHEQQALRLVLPVRGLKQIVKTFKRVRAGHGADSCRARGVHGEL